jgi:hypothetical protein
MRRIRLALLSGAIGADSGLINLSTALGATAYVTVHFRLLRDRDLGCLIVPEMPYPTLN